MTRIEELAHAVIAGAARWQDVQELATLALTNSDINAVAIQRDRAIDGARQHAQQAAEALARLQVVAGCLGVRYLGGSIESVLAAAKQAQVDALRWREREDEVVDEAKRLFVEASKDIAEALASSEPEAPPLPGLHGDHWVGDRHGLQRDMCLRDAIEAIDARLRKLEAK